MEGGAYQPNHITKQWQNRVGEKRKRKRKKPSWLVTSITHCHPNSHYKDGEKKTEGERKNGVGKNAGISPSVHNCALYKISRAIIISHYNHWQTQHSVVMLLLLEAVSPPPSTHFPHD